MEHHFNVNVASIYGVHEAVFIHNLYWWISKNEANGRHYYEGRNWTYNSLTALQKLFPYFTRSQLRTVIANCENKGAVIKGNFNKAGYDNTNWYALTEEIWEMYGRCADIDTDYAKSSRGYAENRTDYARNRTTIPDSKPVINTDSNTPLPPKGKTISEESFLVCSEILASSDLSADEKQKLGQWLQHKRERKDKYTETGFRALLTEYQNNVKQFGRDAVFKAIEQSMAGGYAGIVWDKLKNQTYNQPKTKNYDYDGDDTM